VPLLFTSVGQQHLFVTLPYTVLQGTEKPWQMLNTPTPKHVPCLWRRIFYIFIYFCRNNILSEGPSNTAT
jgi:hypothetical protein